MKLLATRKADQNKAVADPWTAVHLGTGLAAGLVEMPFLAAMSAAVLYEVVEQFAEQAGVGQRVFKVSRPENVANSAFDVVVFGFGWWLGRRYNRS